MFTLWPHWHCQCSRKPDSKERVSFRVNLQVNVLLAAANRLQRRVIVVVFLSDW